MSELKAISVVITPERPDTPNAMQLIAELEAILLPQYPPQSCHGYSVEKLIAGGLPSSSSARMILQSGAAASSCTATSTANSNVCTCVPPSVASVLASGS